MTMMTMIALVFKILLLMITQENDRNIMTMIENGRFSRTLDPIKLGESLVGP